MPDGPVVISPDGLFPSLFREGSKAVSKFDLLILNDLLLSRQLLEEHLMNSRFLAWRLVFYFLKLLIMSYKSCLQNSVFFFFLLNLSQEIRALFPPEHNPFYAGFGNRDTDEISYLKVGIPRGKIFTINPKVLKS